MLIILISTILLVAVAILIFILIKNKKEGKIIEQEINIDAGKLENEFNTLFNNEESEYVKTRYLVLDEKSGEFMVKATFPYLDINTEEARKINKEIEEVFINKLVKLGNESHVYSTFELDYTAETNENILSLMIKCVIKEGRNPKRTIIKTYNYDLENERKVELIDLITEGKKVTLQEKIKNKINQEIKKEEAIIKQGYNTYRRDINSNIYELSKGTDFYIGTDKIIYIIYSYGNNTYTSEVDLIIDKIN